MDMMVVLVNMGMGMVMGQIDGIGGGMQVARYMLTVIVMVMVRVMTMLLS